MPGRPTSPSPGGEGPRPPFRPLDVLALGLELLLGASAVSAGALMVLAPDGSSVSLPPSSSGPFGSFLVPGLLLFVVVGGALAAAGVTTLSRRPVAPLLTVLAGAVLCGWISVQVTMIGLTSFLQMFVFFAGLLLIGAYARRAVRFVATPE